jgi:hypothetical protein
MPRTRAVNLLIGLGLFAAAAISAYWAAWVFAPDLVQSRSPADADYAIYVAFEQAFPLADGFLAVVALAGAVGLWKMRAWGFLCMLVAGGAALFLGCMDLLYDLEHRMFTPLTAEALIELGIVTLVWLLGLVVIGVTWHERRHFTR